MPKLQKITCAECGTGFEPYRHTVRYCSPACRSAFMNRRAQRGAQMYDFVMARRYDRLTEKEARSIIDNLARASRDADKAHREGRPSWLPFEEAKQSVPLAYGSSGDNR